MLSSDVKRLSPDEPVLLVSEFESIKTEMEHRLHKVNMNSSAAEETAKELKICLHNDLMDVLDYTVMDDFFNSSRKDRMTKTQNCTINIGTNIWMFKTNETTTLSRFEQRPLCKIRECFVPHPL